MWSRRAARIGAPILSSSWKKTAKPTGCGTQDIKSGDAVLVATLIRFKREHFVPARDLILALTADEEGGTSNGVDWLLKNRRELIDAEYVLNPDSGGVDSEQGRVV